MYIKVHPKACQRCVLYLRVLLGLLPVLSFQHKIPYILFYPIIRCNLIPLTNMKVNKSSQRYIMYTIIIHLIKAHII